MQSRGPYALRHHGQWRIVVPIYGRLTPRMCLLKFETRPEAEAWLTSEEAKAEIDGLARRRTAPDAERVISLGG